MRVLSVKDLPRELLKSTSGLVPEVLYLLAHLRSSPPKGHSMSADRRKRKAAFEVARGQSRERCRSLMLQDCRSLAELHPQLDTDGKHLRAIVAAADVPSLESAWVTMRIAARSLALRTPAHQD